jgi:hypothetical protein
MAKGMNPLLDGIGPVVSHGSIENAVEVQPAGINADDALATKGRSEVLGEGAKRDLEQLVVSHVVWLHGVPIHSNLIVADGIHHDCCFLIKTMIIVD